MDAELIERMIVGFKEDFDLDEPIEQLMDKAYQNHILEQYGINMENSPMPLFKAMIKAKESANVDSGYKGFTEIIVRRKVDISSSHALQGWLRSRNTVEFLSLWERANNLSFLEDQAELLKKEAANGTSTLTLKQWVARTNAKGIVAIQGRYGGAYAHPIIASDFEAWLSANYRFTLMRSYHSDKNR